MDIYTKILAAIYTIVLLVIFSINIAVITLESQRIIKKPIFIYIPTINTNEETHMEEKTNQIKARWCCDAKINCAAIPTIEEIESPETPYCYLGTHIECSRFLRIKDKCNTNQ